MNKEQEQFYNSLRNSGKFSKAQLDIIPEFLEWGLTSNQIELFADPSCSPKHLEQIYIGLTDGLSEDQVRIFADPSISADDMRDMYMKLEEQNAHKHEVQPERKSVRVTPPVQRKDKNR
jgi:hypothetical protein